MKVDKPKFSNGGSYLEGCKHCPFTDQKGQLLDGCERLCEDWTGLYMCPNTSEEYAEACAFAEAAEKEGR